MDKPGDLRVACVRAGIRAWIVQRRVYGRSQQQAIHDIWKGKQPARKRLAGTGWLVVDGLFVEDFPEDRIDIVLIANMLHGEIIKAVLQHLIFPPQRLV